MAGRIRDSDIAEVRDRVRIDEVVGEYVALRRAGAGSLKGLCPFHDEKSPSFTVRPTHGTFHCFGCAERGDVIDFVMQIEHHRVRRGRRAAGRPDRLPAHLRRRRRSVAARPRHPDPAAGGEQEGRRVLRRRSCAPPRPPPRSRFLTSRGFDAAAAQRFGCGYAPAGWDALTKHLLAAGFSLDELMKAGPVARRAAAARSTGSTAACCGRSATSAATSSASAPAGSSTTTAIEAKYLNTPETPVYRKTHVLFGLDLAKREIAKRRQVVVVEGYTDVMAMHLAGVPTAVASCGTAFGAEHIGVIRRLIGDDSFDLGEVIYTFDGDAAGQAAALKAFDGEQSVRHPDLRHVAPDGQDPCELRQSPGDTAVRDLVARREPIFEFAIRSMLRELRPRHRRGPGGRPAAHACRWSPGSSARSCATSTPAASRAGRAGTTSRWSCGGCGRRRARPPSRAARASGRRRRPAATTRACTVQREALKAALQVPAIAGPSYDELPEQAFTHPALAAGAPGGAGGGRGVRRPGGPAVAGGRGRRVHGRGPRAGRRAGRRAAGAAAAQAHALGERRGPLRREHRRRGAAGAGGRQIAEIKSRLQRTNPVDEPTPTTSCSATSCRWSSTGSRCARRRWER